MKSTSISQKTINFIFDFIDWLVLRALFAKFRIQNTRCFGLLNHRVFEVPFSVLIHVWGEVTQHRINSFLQFAGSVWGQPLGDIVPNLLLESFLIFHRTIMLLFYLFLNLALCIAKWVLESEFEALVTAKWAKTLVYLRINKLYRWCDWRRMCKCRFDWRYMQLGWKWW